MHLRGYFHTRYALHNELCCHDCFGFSHIVGTSGIIKLVYTVFMNGYYIPEQELTIQVADINGVHVNNMNIFEPR